MTDPTSDVDASSKRHILITAGPTWEPIDSVRFLGNRSSGQMGLALTEAALAVGHQVTLLMGRGATVRQSHYPATSKQFELLRFESVADLDEQMNAHFSDCDLLIMAAAVSDFTFDNQSEKKLERESSDELLLRLRKTPDLVKRIAGRRTPDQRIVAFALEENDRLAERAQAKLKRKGVDVIVGNPIQTMDSSNVTATIWQMGDDEPMTLPPLSKQAFAQQLIKLSDSFWK